MTFNTVIDQSDLANLTVVSWIFPGKDETISHPSSITGSQHDEVHCATRNLGVSNPCPHY